MSVTSDTLLEDAPQERTGAPTSGLTIADRNLPWDPDPLRHSEFPCLVPRNGIIRRYRSLVKGIFVEIYHPHRRT